MKVKDVFPSKYLKVDDLEDNDWNVTIARTVLEDIGQGESKQTKLVIYFDGIDKGFVCNKTNASVIEKLYGDETNDWKGKRITLWPNHDVQFKGEIVSAIRVRAKAPKPVGPKGHRLNQPAAIEAGSASGGDEETPF